METIEKIMLKNSIKDMLSNLDVDNIKDHTLLIRLFDILFMISHTKKEPTEEELVNTLIGKYFSITNEENGSDSYSFRIVEISKEERGYNDVVTSVVAKLKGEKYGEITYIPYDAAVELAKRGKSVHQNERNDGTFIKCYTCVHY